MSDQEKQCRLCRDSIGPFELWWRDNAGILCLSCAGMDWRPLAKTFDTDYPPGSRLIEDEPPYLYDTP